MKKIRTIVALILSVGLIASQCWGVILIEGGGGGSTNIVTNGDFSDGSTGWSVTNGTLDTSSSTGKLVASSTSNPVLEQTLGCTEGIVYDVLIDVVAVYPADEYYRIENSNTDLFIYSTSTGTDIPETFTCTAGDYIRIRRYNGVEIGDFVTVDNIRIVPQ